MNQSDDAVFKKAEDLALEAVSDPYKIPHYIFATKKAQDLEGHPRILGSRKKMTQGEKILAHMRASEDKSITQREAYLDYSIQSFTKRISELRQQGYDIRGLTKKHPTTGQEYTRYYLVEEMAV